MDNKKLFISLPVDPALVSKLIKQFNKLALPFDKLRPVLPENFHLTVKFLGFMPLEQLPAIIETINRAVVNFGYLDLRLERPEIFPADRAKQPRVLSLHLQSDDKLQRLFDLIDQSLFAAGLAHKEPRRFVPHLTIARVKKAAAYDEFADYLNWKTVSEISVNSLQLQESISGDLGPEYIVLENFEL